MTNSALPFANDDLHTIVRGEWDGQTAYLSSDLVQHNGALWIALQDIAAVAAPAANPAPASNNAAWRIVYDPDNINAARHIFGDNEGRAHVLDFNPADSATLPAFFRFGPNAANGPAGVSGTGFGFTFRDTQGASHDPIRMVIRTDGPQSQVWESWKMGNVFVWARKDLPANGTVTLDMLDQDLQALVQRQVKTIYAVASVFKRQASNLPAPSRPDNSEFDLTVSADGGYTAAYTGNAGWGNQPQGAVPAGEDEYEVAISIKASGADDTSPVAVVGVVIKTDHADASIVGGGLTQAQVQAIVDNAIAAQDDLTQGQKDTVRIIIDASLQTRSFQTAEQVQTAVAAAIAGQTGLTDAQSTVVRNIITTRLSTTGFQTAAQVQAVVDAAIANITPSTVTISVRGEGADSELVYVEGQNNNAIGIRLVPAPTEDAATGRWVLAAQKVGQTLKYGWYNIQAVIQSARLAVKAELTGQINLLSEAINSLGRVQQWSAVLTELARGMFTAAAGASWKQNIEGQRTYPAALDWLWIKWGQEYRGSGKNYVTGGNTNDINIAGRWNLVRPGRCVRTALCQRRRRRQPLGRNGHFLHRNGVFRQRTQPGRCAG